MAEQTAAERYPRTWHREPWHPLFIRQLACGCWEDDLAERIWEPCPAHESEGHLSGIRDQPDGTTTARCLVMGCQWRTTRWTGMDVVLAAQDHWAATRAASGH